MDQQKIDMFLMTNKKYFPDDKFFYLKEKLQNVDESKWMMISSMEFKDPMVMFLISFFVGALGVDRFMLGDVAMGVLKLLTGGLCGILALIDWVTIMNKTKEVNFNNVISLL